MTYSLESIAFLDHSKEFARLNQKFKQFNPFKVLRVDHFEIRHSNVLAWLFDPNENHALGSFFLRKVLSRLITKAENDEKTEKIDFLPFLYGSLSEAIVQREVKTTNRYIDLIVKVPSQKLVILIENKFHATESAGQLEDYLQFAQKHYEGCTIIPVFLTLNGDAPSHSDYWVLDYHDILQMITLHLDLNKEAIADSIYDFLKYYASILNEELIQDEEMLELALEVYKNYQSAIELLFFSQHPEFRKQPRYSELYRMIDELDNGRLTILKSIYEKSQETVDFIFKIGGNVLREAFAAFVQKEKFPEEVYHAHFRVPYFILPEWEDFKEAIGEPEESYWLGHALIIWFERTWDELLKVNIEVGPIPYEKRLKLLTSLQKEGISFRESAKLEGKKYTKIYTQTISVSDWADKAAIAEGMEKLFYDPKFKTTLKRIALAVEAMEEEKEQQEEAEMGDRINFYGPIEGEAMGVAFLKFAERHNIASEHYRVGNRVASFLQPQFRELEQIYGGSREKWWWHDSTFTLWFEKLKDDRLKLTLELGPLQPEKRRAIIKKLEESGISFSAQSKLSSAKYTRIFSKANVIKNWENAEEVLTSMEELFNEPKNQDLLDLISALKEASFSY